MPQTNPAPSGASDRPVHAAAPNRGRGSVNTLHSRLNPTCIRRIERPDSVQTLRRLLRRTEADGVPVCIAGGRHAMGGQQFASGAVLIDMTAMDRVLAFDAHKGHIDVEAGICWPELLAWLARVQRDRQPQWGIRQKQTGADRISIGGTLSANAHGRGLNMKPFVDDVESFTLLGADGRIRTCSRDRNSELFALAIGGYGLFGIIVTVRLRLMRRTKMQRLVSVIDLTELVAAVEDRVATGCLYGDFQFAIDPLSDDFLRKGIFSCYQPIRDNAVMPTRQKELHAEDWTHLLYLAHVHKSRAFEIYSRHYLSTHRQRYWSNSHQLSEYLDDYHRWASRRQVQSCYPEFARFLELKMQYDPGERFQSEWYRHYKSMFADALESADVGAAISREPVFPGVP
ncbi:MAG: hypothetical protein BMS9Abin01_2789 [Gammaproteobacteria bacterium]|nr:MAG: hypothetical protein BMS9Abin01_2789 [Gammaproteobacteria bacterium]